MKRFATIALALFGLTQAIAEKSDLQPALDDSFVETESPLATAFVRYCDAATKRDRAPASKPTCLEAEKEFQSILSTHDRRALRFLQSVTEKLSDGCAPYAWEALARISLEKFAESREAATKGKNAPSQLPQWLEAAQKGFSCK